MENITGKEKSLIISALGVLVTKLNSKIKNDVRNGRSAYIRVEARERRIEEAERLIVKLKDQV